MTLRLDTPEVSRFLETIRRARELDRTATHRLQRAQTLWARYWGEVARPERRGRLLRAHQRAMRAFYVTKDQLVDLTVQQARYAAVGGYREH